MYVSSDLSSVLLKMLHPSHAAEVHSKMTVGENISPDETSKKFLVDNRSIEIEYKVYTDDDTPRARMLLMAFSANSDSEHEFNRTDIRASIIGNSLSETLTLQQALYKSKVSYAYGDFISRIVAIATKSAQTNTVMLTADELLVFIADSSGSSYELISFDLRLK